MIKKGLWNICMFPKNKEKLNLRVSISKLSLVNGQEFAILTFYIF